jgi:hypothetical protein
MTCREQIDLEIVSKQKEIWLQGIDLLAHVLRGDYMDTAWKSNTWTEHHLEALREALERKVTVDSLDEIVQETEREVKRYRPFDSDSGEFNLENWLDSDLDDDMIYTEFFKERRRSVAVNLVLGIGMPYSWRRRDDMQKRHRKAYKIALQCEAENRPCRVVGVNKLRLREKTITYFVVIKDWSDPVFSGIWGALRDNRCCNDFVNCVSAYFLGTSDTGNGMPLECSMTDFDLEGEVVVIEPSAFVQP